jgi:hypothetical protein
MQPDSPIVLIKTSPSSVLAARYGAVAARRACLVSIVGLAAVGGLAVGVALAPDTPAEAEYVMLIRFMAIMKAAIVVACIALVAWRLGDDIRPQWAAAYISAVGLMTISPGLIWNLAALPEASAVFHAGLLLGLALAAADGYARRQSRQAATPARPEHI